jgi:hypothetical protein
VSLAYASTFVLRRLTVGWSALQSAIKKAMAIRAAALSVRSQAFNPGSAAAVDDDRSDYWLPYAVSRVAPVLACDRLCADPS